MFFEKLELGVLLGVHFVKFFFWKHNSLGVLLEVVCVGFFFVLILQNVVHYLHPLYVGRIIGLAQLCKHCGECMETLFMYMPPSLIYKRRVCL